MLRASCLTLEINEFRCYEAKIEESEKAGSHRLCGFFHFPLFSPQGSKFELGTSARCRITRMAEYCESSRLSEVGEVPHQTECHIFPRRQFGKSKVVSCVFQRSLFGAFWVIFFKYVSVSNLENETLHRIFLASCGPELSTLSCSSATSNHYIPQGGAAWTRRVNAVLSGEMQLIYWMLCIR